MSRLSRDLSRKRLSKLLGAAPDEHFLELVWATDALQSGREGAARKILGTSYPPEAASSDMAGKYAIHKWELETLINEAFTTPKQIIKKKHHTKFLNCRNYMSMVTATNILRNLENHEYEVSSKPREILNEMARIAGRQFDWQRGYFNIPLFYRSAFIYGQGHCAEYLKQKYHTSLAEMTLVGFSLRTVAEEFPAFSPTISVPEIGLDREALKRVLSIISCPVANVRGLAKEQRAEWRITAYKPSVLRQYPCISFHNSERFFVPLPDLVIERVTSGIFYDLVDGGGSIRNEYGRRFERYSELYIQAQLPGLQVSPEWKYKVDGQSVDTPDLVIGHDDQVDVAIECKASRMSFAARFGDEPGSTHGYNDIVKGVVQLWRFCSSCRRGKTGRNLAPDVSLVLLTLDSWLVMGGPITRGTLQRAHELADAKFPSILAQDRRPIIFCPIADLEGVLADADETSFRQALRKASQPEFDGYMLSTLHKDFAPDRPRKKYPFDDLGELLPWWGTIAKKRAERQLAN